MSVFSDEDKIIPVRLEIKKFNDKDNILYVATSFESIKKDEIVKIQDAQNGVAHSFPSSIISLTELIKK